MTCTLIVNPGLLAYVDDEDAPLLRRYTWTRCMRPNTVYAQSRIDGALVFLHRFILNYYGGEDVDHRNGNGLDCRKSNIWVAGETYNALNRPNALGVRERRLRSGRSVFDSHVKYLDKSYHLGTFQTYDRALRMAALNKRRLLQGCNIVAYKADYPHGPRSLVQL